jgi:hypothetical protein
MRKVWALTALAACVVAFVSVQAQQKMSKKPTLTPQDYAEIQMLYSRYDHGFDSAADQGRMFAGCFTPDGGLVLQGGRTIEGQEALAKMAARDGSKPYNIRHIGVNALVEPSADGASGLADFLLVTVNENGKPPTVTSGGSYQDSIVKTADGWRFKKRLFTSWTFDMGKAAPPR